MSTPPDPGRARDDAEAVTRRIDGVDELIEQLVTQARQFSLVWLESCERVLENVLDFEEQAARGLGLEWATTLAMAHASFVRETSEVFLGALREQLKH